MLRWSSGHPGSDVPASYTVTNFRYITALAKNTEGVLSSCKRATQSARLDAGYQSRPGLIWATLYRSGTATCLETPRRIRPRALIPGVSTPDRFEMEKESIGSTKRMIRRALDHVLGPGCPYSDAS